MRCNKGAVYTEITRQIEVQVRPTYLREHSSPERHHYVWSYHITIQNHGSETVQLLNRYWRIVDAHDQVQEVRGPGVVGEHPILAKGEQYSYSSFTHLPTTTGSMSGAYQMRANSGEVFEIAIPHFSLIVSCRLVVSNEAVLC